MKKSLLAKLTSNMGTKVLSLVIAVFIWYIAVYADDPVTTVSFNAHVTVTNESYIQNGKQVYHIDDTYKTVTVYVKGNQSKIKNLKESNITVTADLTQIVDLEREPVMVPLTATCTGFTAADITLSRQTIPITIEDIQSKDLPVTVLTGDTVPNKNYEIGKMTSDPESITVIGPSSVISTIDSVVAYIDVTNMVASGARTATLSYIDKNQNTISEETISDDITIEGEIENVIVYVELWRKRSGVTFDVEYAGTPAEGYQVYSIKTSPDEVTVAGNEDALTWLSDQGNVITIPESMVDVSGKLADFKVSCDITELFPENMKVASSMNDTIDITVNILPEESREYKYDVDKINVRGLDSQLSISYNSPEVLLRIKSVGGDFSLLDDSSIKVELGVDGLEAGEYTGTLIVTLPEEFELVENATVKFTLVKKAAAS